jgi:uncharacterized membrane protein YphA (DoxX/SURF4 family)
MKLKYLLQIGLAFVFLFAGVDSLVHAADWISFVPQWVTTFGLSLDMFLKLNALVEIAIGLLLLIPYTARFGALIAALELLGIIVSSGFSHGILLITFRDVGLFFSATYLAFDKS